MEEVNLETFRTQSNLASMSTVLEIEKAIENLPSREFWQIVDWLEKKCEESEDAADNAAADAALAEGGDPIPWEEVQRKCGLLP